MPDTHPAPTNQRANDDEREIYAEPVELNGLPVRTVIYRDLPFFAVADICNAARMPLDLTLSERIASVHSLEAGLPDESGTIVSTPFLTPIGVFTLALYIVDVGRKMALHRWVFKTAKAIREDAFDREKHGAAQMMALRPDGDVPPTPHRSTGRQYEHQALRDLPEYIAARTERYLAARSQEAQDAWLRGQDAADSIQSSIDAVFAEMRRERGAIAR